MRYIIIMFLLATFISCNKTGKFVKAKIRISEIDTLKTEAEIEKYIGEKDTLYRIFKLQTIQNTKIRYLEKIDSLNKVLAKKVNVNYSYFKADFDNNGYTDLLAIGDNDTHDGHKYNVNYKIPWTKNFNVIVLMNFNSNKTKTIDLDKNEFDFPIVPKVEFINSQPFITVYKQEIEPIRGLKGKAASKSKLIYKFDGFVEYNPEEKSFDIEKIEFYMTPCMGNCPLYNYQISSDRSTKFAEGYYGFSTWKKKYLKATISEKEYNDITGILNYIDFEKLNDNYNVEWTDDRGSILKITYNGGKVKTINDYGLLGTYGLQRVYEMLFKLRTTHNWK